MLHRLGSEHPSGQHTEWYDTAFHSSSGMHHLDLRRSGNGILITAAPADVDGVPGLWQLRLRNDDEEGLTDLAGALADGRDHALGNPAESVVVFMPHEPAEGLGTLARARGVDSGAPYLERRAERPMHLWADAGENLLTILPSLPHDQDPATAPDDDFVLCPGCGQPVYDSSPTVALLSGPVSAAGLCTMCADGRTLHTLKETGTPVPEEQRTILEAAALRT